MVFSESQSVLVVDRDVESQIIRSASLAAGESRQSGIPDSDLVRCLRLLRMVPAHISPFRHAKVQIKIVTDRAVSAELFRHKFLEGENVEFDAVEQSTRYCDYSNGIPILSDVSDVCLSAIPTGIDECLLGPEAVYSELREAGMKDTARRVLPLATVTKLTCAATLEGWARFYINRVSPRCDYIMVDLARLLDTAMRSACPMLWPAMVGALKRPSSPHEIEALLRGMRREDVPVVLAEVLDALCMEWDGNRLIGNDG